MWPNRRSSGAATDVAIALAGAIAYVLLPVSPLPQVEFPTINVGAGLPGASPETMASAVATPLERQFGRIAGITEMTSVSFLGASTIALQFDLARDINGAARDVQSAIASAAGQRERQGQQRRRDRPPDERLREVHAFRTRRAKRSKAR